MKYFTSQVIIVFLFLQLPLSQCNGQCKFEIDSLFGSTKPGIQIVDSAQIFQLSNGSYMKSDDDDHFVIGTIRDSSIQFRGTIVKFNKNGSIDNSFGKNGKVFVNNSGSSILRGGIKLLNGSMLVCGNLSSGVLVAKFNSQGQLDPSFAKNGIYTEKSILSFGNGTSILVDKNNSIYVSGYVSTRNTGFFILKLDLNGKLDSSFATNGVYKYESPIETLESEVEMENINDNLFIGFSTGSGNLSDIIISKFNSNGIIDTTFGKSGRLTIDRGFNDHLYSMKNTSDGYLTLYGYIRYTSSKWGGFLTKIDLNGNINNQFDPNGYKLYNSYLPLDMEICNNNLVLLNGEHDGTTLYATLSSVDLISGKMDSTIGDNGVLKFYLGNLATTPYHAEHLRIHNDKITIYGHNGYGLASFAQAKILKPSATIQNNSTSPFAIFPNPTNAELKFIPIEDNYVMSFTIFDSFAREILSAKEFNVNHDYIDVSNFKSGYYFLKIFSKGKYFYSKFLKI
ncbi:MAG: T9SS type A sorting domain-containing protein [Saprospiraceae bacterium]|nr:T9SS type A sorting domain-containing protein [Saprospiraceae bacterium]